MQLTFGGSTRSPHDAWLLQRSHRGVTRPIWLSEVGCGSCRGRELQPTTDDSLLMVATNPRGRHLCADVDAAPRPAANVNSSSKTPFARASRLWLGLRLVHGILMAI
jgi:hypothetical protein